MRSYIELTCSVSICPTCRCSTCDGSQNLNQINSLKSVTASKPLEGYYSFDSMIDLFFDIITENYFNCRVEMTPGICCICYVNLCILHMCAFIHLQRLLWASVGLQVSVLLLFTCFRRHERKCEP